MDWSKVKFVFCDERLVPFDDADSTYGVYKNSDIFKLEVMRLLTFESKLLTTLIQTEGRRRVELRGD